ncbi:phosphodiester glycosidase family protein [Mesobacterium pallidum]|uniref:phosphodiester glycosidase family protein n=1 Tax=Mesobacterium pallidum TaxID=2872037 RepID=UPI001EE1D928|nr:phosphodiester glycosidase family protein [Mesobacterium pallidum]
MRRLLAALLALVPALSPALAGDCRAIDHESNRYTICDIDPATEELRLFLRDGTGAPYGHFRNVDAALAGEGKRLGIAMNAGMYHDDRRPVGLYVEDGQQEMRLVTSAGPGNFGLLPNGVFCIGDGWARVIETKAFEAAPPACRHASQSGPMLVIDGALHPRFLVDSTSRYIRNGVGTTEAGDRVVLAISQNPVTFHEFGRLFRDVLELPQALYFDGNVSRLHDPANGRRDGGRTMGPILGTVVPR